jgi:uncharacterized protein (TIGR02145 family)
MKQKLFFLMLTLIMLSVASVQAQVTIGTDEPPHSAAVLDLQSTALGFKLPTIELGDVSVFQLSGTTTNADGIMIYNSSEETTGGSGKGIYVWEGKWVFAGKSAPVEVPVTKITILSEGNSMVVNSGSTLQLNAIIEPAAPNGPSNPTLAWTIVYNPAATAGSATIDAATGKITGVKPGAVTARATATDGSGVYGNFAFSVFATDYASSITVTSVNTLTSVVVGKSIQLQAEVAPISAVSEVEWSVDAGSTDYATVDQTGKVIGLAEGSATILANAVDDSGIVGQITLDILPGAIVEPTNVLIGENYYDTYDFNGTTWMVQSSKEGNWSFDRYSGNAGRMRAYYLHADAESACPDGWSVPSAFQARQLVLYLQSSDCDVREIDLFFRDEPASGYTFPNQSGVDGWNGWDTQFNCWTSTTNMRLVATMTTLPGSTNVQYLSITDYPAFKIPVRCVK